MDSRYYLGLMSGTSADAIDAVLVNLPGAVQSITAQLIGHASLPLPDALRHEIHQLARPGNNEIDRLGHLDRQLGKLFAEACLILLEQCRLTPKQVEAIGSHGQTIRHRPPLPQSPGFTLQIGDPNIIAQDTGITTVADFRRRDMAVGGQGAPLVPAFHKAVFHSTKINRVVVNIGGVANLTLLPTSGNTLGYDTGPGNSLMDTWIHRHQGLTYDAQGRWAGSGKVHHDLLQSLLDHEFFRLPPPKSTGREAFNSTWLEQILAQQKNPIAPADVQATLLELTAETIAREINHVLGSTAGEVYVCGGGALNEQLMRTLQTKLEGIPIASTEAVGIHPQHVEAMAFAWLAQQTLERKRGNIPTVTGAYQEVILGGVYFA
jgi:anhydro-N-acetylmuramic acid kinase